MAIVYSDGVIEIAVHQAYGVKTAVNVFHMRWDGEWGDDIAEDVVGDFRDNWQDHVLDIQSAFVTVERFEWRSLDMSSGANGVVLPDAAKPLVGQLAGSSLAVNSSYLIHKNTSNRPRGRRDGRMYLTGCLEGDVGGDGSLLSSRITSANTALASFYNGISDTGWNAAGDRYPVVLETTPASRAPGNETVVIGSRRITSLTCDPIIGTQRERMR